MRSVRQPARDHCPHQSAQETRQAIEGAETASHAFARFLRPPGDLGRPSLAPARARTAGKIGPPGAFRVLKVLKVPIRLPVSYTPLSLFLLFGD